MFETDQLREEFDQILQAKRSAAERLDRLAVELDQPELRRRVAELQAHAQRHVELTERLLELVS